MIGNFIVIVDVVINIVIIYLLLRYFKKKINKALEIPDIIIEKELDRILAEAGYYQGVKKDKLKSVLIQEYKHLNLKTVNKIRNRIYQLENTSIFD